MTIDPRLILAAWATMACAPGEVERHFTYTPTVPACPLIYILPTEVCGPVQRGKQDCHMVYPPQPPLCDTQPTTIVSCLDPSEAKVGATSIIPGAMSQ